MSGKEKEEKILKAKKLFQKGNDSYNNKNYYTALNYFNESEKLIKDLATEDYIKATKERIKEKNEKDEKNFSKGLRESREEKEKCLKIIDSQDFYQILNLSKNSEPKNQEIKNSYKKLCLIYHPDINISYKSEEAFKKISFVYKSLIDKNNNNKSLSIEYINPYVIFYEVLQEEYKNNNSNNNNDNNIFNDNVTDNFDVDEILKRQRIENENKPKPPDFMKMMPVYRIIVIGLAILNFICPFFYKGDYDFFPKNGYVYKNFTKKLNVTYYYGEEFIKKYGNLSRNDEKFIKLENEIEKKFWELLNDLCNKKKEEKKKLDKRLLYYRKNTNYYSEIQNEIKNFNFSICDKFLVFNQSFYNNSNINKNDNK